MADFTASEVAEILLALRRRIIKIIAIIAVVWAITFAAVADPLLVKIIEDLYPEDLANAQNANLEELAKVTEELKRITETLENYLNNPNNESLRENASQALKDLSKLSLRVSANPIYTKPLEGLILKLKISLLFGVVAALPYMLYLAYQTLKYRTEVLKNVSISKIQLIKYIVASIVLFSLGTLYGYFILKFFLEFLYRSAVSQGVYPLYTVSEFINFVVLMLVIFGLIFQMPLIMLFLVSNGLVNFSTFAYYRRHFYVVFFILGAVITPPDVFTQAIVALPMIVFFEVSMIFIRIIHRNKIKKQKAMKSD